MPVDSIILDPNSRSILYVGTDVGIYRGRQVDAHTWQWDKVGDGLPAVQVSDLQIQNSRTGEFLIAGTHGRGAWKFDLSSLRTQFFGEGGSTGVTLGSFTDPTGAGPDEVTVDWGDGNVASGTVDFVTESTADIAWDDGSTSADALTLGEDGSTWTLSANYAWDEEGAYLVTTNVTMADGYTVTLDDLTADVADAPLSASAQNVHATVGTAFTAAVATFADADPNGELDDYSAEIDWGDGSVTAGTIQPAEGGGFVVVGDHAYSDARSYTFQVSIFDVGGAEADADGTAVVAGPVMVTGPAAVEGESTGPVTVATFTAPAADDYTALITWGDGQVSYGEITAAGGGSYIVQGSNTYAEEGHYTLTISIAEGETAIGSASDSVVVADAPLSASASDLSAIAGTPLTDVIGTFTDADPNAEVGDFTAFIDWGDGGLTQADVQAADGGGFNIVGSHTYAAAGDYPFTVYVYDEGGSAAEAGGDAIVLAPTSTTLTSSLDPSCVGQAVTFTATVASDGGAPTGTVSFYDGATPLSTEALDSNGAASLTTASLSVGDHTIRAVYSGDAYDTSSAAAMDQTVLPQQSSGQVSSSLSLSSSLNPSTVGQSVTFTASVAGGDGGAPTGVASFFIDGAPAGTVGLSTGAASISASFSSVGSHSIQAVYGGDAVYAGSSGALTQTVQQATPMLCLTSSADPSLAGQAVTFQITATASGGATPTGTMTFMDGQTVLGTATLDASGAATFTTAALSVGQHSITVVYGGDAGTAPATSEALTQTVNSNPQGGPTWINLVASSDPAPQGQPVTFTASVQHMGGGAPTGTVSFYDGTTLLAVVDLTNGAATFTTSSLSLGDHYIRAVYSGDADFGGSSSQQLDETID